ncbi:MAG: hypothetical protein ACJASN_003260, partial [Cyclobacteriaceae bacterium]
MECASHTIVRTVLSTPTGHLIAKNIHWIFSKRYVLSSLSILQKLFTPIVA